MRWPDWQIATSGLLWWGDDFATFAAFVRTALPCPKDPVDDACDVSFRHR